MDILRPPTVWIDGCCYRRNPGDVAEEDSGDVRFTGDTVDEFDDDNLADGRYDEDDDGDQTCPEIKANEGGTKFQMSFHVASAFFALIIGKKGATKKRIEGETGTRIAIPRQGAEGDIVVTGSSAGSVRSAWSRLQVMVDSARGRHEFTHFVSLPVNHAEMREALAKFKAECLEKFEGRARGLDCSVFQDPGLLHLTIGTMALMDEEERKKAVSLLEECREEILSPLLRGRPLRVRVEGLEIMNDDPAEVDVIYAKVASLDDGEREEDPLQILSDRLVEKFVSSGLMVRQYDRVKLHLTLVNTLFRTDEKAGIFDNEVTGGRASRDKGGGPQQQTRTSVDARDVLAEFGNRTFVPSLTLREVHLSQRRAGRRTEDGYYWPTGKIAI